MSNTNERRRVERVLLEQGLEVGAWGMAEQVHTDRAVLWHLWRVQDAEASRERLLSGKRYEHAAGVARGAACILSHDLTLPDGRVYGTVELAPA